METADCLAITQNIKKKSLKLVTQCFRKDMSIIFSISHVGEGGDWTAILNLILTVA